MPAISCVETRISIASKYIYLVSVIQFDSWTVECLLTFNMNTLFKELSHKLKQYVTGKALPDNGHEKCKAYRCFFEPDGEILSTYSLSLLHGNYFQVASSNITLKYDYRQRIKFKICCVYCVPITADFFSLCISTTFCATVTAKRGKIYKEAISFSSLTFRFI